jgi:L-fuculose-phosphate aldolase
MSADLVAACHRLAARGLVIGTAGNVSVRDGDQVSITATGASFETIDADQVTVVDLDGQLLEGDLEPTSELNLHLGLYRAYEVGAVVHTHAPMATALSTVLDELPCIHYQLLQLGGSVRVAPYATFGTHELATAVVDACKDRSAALMANHGAVTTGSTLAKAVDNALLLEWGCSVYWHAAALGQPRLLTDDEQAAVIEQAIARSYGTTRPRNEEQS